MIVLDACVVLELLMGSKAGQKVAQRLKGNPALHVPHLVDIEVAHALRRFTASKQIGPQRAYEAVQDLTMLPLQRHAHQHLLARIWELRLSITAYDATYIALAEALDSTLLTLDARLFRSHGHAARVELIA